MIVVESIITLRPSIASNFRAAIREATPRKSTLGGQESLSDVGRDASRGRASTAFFATRLDPRTAWLGTK